MGKKRKQLSQAEVWDDSALVQSWDDALEEYKLYHSIHARGERVEDVIQEASREDEDIKEVDGLNAHDLATNVRSTCTAPEDLEEGELEDMEDGEVEAATKKQMPELNSATIEKATSATHPQQSNAPDTTTAGNLHDVPSAPSAIFARFQDDALKNLMMSWYYAGYYTGLYEGQKQAAKA